MQTITIEIKFEEPLDKQEVVDLVEEIMSHREGVISHTICIYTKNETLEQEDEY